MRLFCILLLAAITLLGTTFAQTASKRRLVANLKNNTVADGCGCYFRFPGTDENSQKYIFFSSIEEDDENTAWMNIGGEDLKVRLVKKFDPKAIVRVGSKSTRQYAAGNILVDVTYVATEVCGRNDESCESTSYAATFVVKKGKAMQTLKATGGCGC